MYSSNRFPPKSYQLLIVATRPRRFLRRLLAVQCVVAQYQDEALETSPRLTMAEANVSERFILPCPFDTASISLVAYVVHCHAHLTVRTQTDGTDPLA
jgi:hypothetical protein